MEEKELSINNVTEIVAEVPFRKSFDSIINDLAGKADSSTISKIIALAERVEILDKLATGYANIYCHTCDEDNIEPESEEEIIRLWS